MDVWVRLFYHAHLCDQEDTEGSKLRTGLMGVLTRHKEPAGQPGVTPAPAAQSKPGRFANLRAKLSKPSEHAEVQHVGMFAVFESTPLLQHGFLHGFSSKGSILFSASMRCLLLTR